MENHPSPPINAEDRLPRPLLATLRDRRPTLWLNPALTPRAARPSAPRVAAAHRLFARAAPLLARLYPELAATEGRLVSPLRAVPSLQRRLWGGDPAGGSWYLKQDHLLPVAGSVKARGAFHEVLLVAERIARAHGIPCPDSDLLPLGTPQARALFSMHTIAVGSTGNLGLAIGLIAAALGFQAVVHMSADAKPWKKERLRARGIQVVEHGGDYASAVAAGRAAASGDPTCHFVDDENSSNLFLGYAAAAAELVGQLEAIGRAPSPRTPVFVYLPCGVGGAPGGITYGLKALAGAASTHCFFAEPVAAPCLLVQLAARGEGPLSVYDVGLDNVTEADGLAVAQASPLVVDLVRTAVSGVLTVDDQTLFADTCLLADTESVHVEPSAAAGMRGPLALLRAREGVEYLRSHALDADALARATHVIWTTGGSLVPAEEQRQFLARGRLALQASEAAAPGGRTAC